MALRAISEKNTGAESVQMPVQNANADAKTPLQMPMQTIHADAHIDLSSVSTDDLLYELVKRFQVSEFTSHLPSTAPGKNMTIRLNPAIRRCIDNICSCKGTTITAVIERAVVLLHAILNREET